MKSISWNFFLSLIFLLLVSFVFLKVWITFDHKQQVSALESRAERICLDHTPIASISYFGDHCDGYAVVTFRREREKKFIYRGVSRKAWDRVKQSRDVVKFYSEHLARRLSRESLLACN